MKERDKTIDFLRGVSIILIVLIHVLSNYSSYQFPSILARYLHFVEALLVFCSGASLAYSHASFKGFTDILSFLKKRLARFYLPWWLFLVVFLLVNFVFDFLAHAPFRYAFQQILKMIFVFGVGGAMGYGWILLLLLALSLLYPLIIKLAEKTGYEKMFFLLVLFSFLMHYIYSLNMLNGFVSAIFYLQFLLPFFLGICYAKRKKVNLRAIAVVYFFLHIFMMYLLHVSGKSIVFTDYKYPPNLFFISYGVFMSLFLVLLFKQKGFKNIISNKIAEFYSRNSMWVYMWHILILGVAYQLFLPFKFMDNEPWWILKFLTVLLICTVIVLVQNFLSPRIKNYINAVINYNLH
jgi:peptidoglycan/LPS O-acetylase OafA/YrhL